MSSFKATRWTLLGAAQLGDPGSRDEVARIYRPPVLRYLRAAGAGQDADDLTQEVFVRLFHNDVLTRATPNAGRFRSLLLAVARNVLRAQRTKAGAKKRGGGQPLLSLDEAQVPQKEREAFDREWILSLLERAIERLACEHPRYHLVMSRAIGGESPAAIAKGLGHKPKDVRNYLHRARKTLARYLHEYVYEFTATPEDHATELALLGSFLPSRAQGVTEILRNP